MVAINQEIMDVDRGMQDLVNEVKLGQGSHCAFIQSFLDTNSTILDDLKLKKEEMESGFKDCVTFFGEEIKTATAESFFGIFFDFFQQYSKARVDNEKEDEIARKNEERAAKLELEQQSRKAAKVTLLINVFSPLRNKSKTFCSPIAMVLWTI
jgi:hypothetical protein